MIFKATIKVLFAAVIICLNAQDVCAQETHSDDHNHSHEGKHDHFHDNEIGISFAAVFFEGESDVHIGFHSHYIKRLGESRFGAGLGVELIPGDVLHQTYSAVFQYSPTYQLHLVLAPGLALEGEDGEEEKETEGMHEEHGATFAIHVEAMYEFHVGFFDLGPSLEFAYDKNDTHYALGLHVGIPF